MKAAERRVYRETYTFHWRRLGKAARHLSRTMARELEPRKLFWKARVAIKRFLARHICIIEFCKRCGRTQPLVWRADDALWLEVYGHAGGVLCPECFDARARAKGLAIQWTAKLEYRCTSPT